MTATQHRESPGGRPRGTFQPCTNSIKSSKASHSRYRKYSSGDTIRFMAHPRSAEAGELRTCARCKQAKPLTREFWKPLSRGNHMVGKTWHNFRGYCRTCLGREGAIRAWRVKQEAVDRYGGCCICCHETRLPFLTFDHTEGNGAEHRRTNRAARKFIHRWLKAKGWPSGFQILCWNCHMARNGGRVCPHQEG